MPTLAEFLVESNAIEGINEFPTEAQESLTESFLELEEIKVGDIENLVRAFQPNARLREPPGGKQIRDELALLLELTSVHDAYDLHLRYETLHPFTDGNGRSGRLLWLWKLFQTEGESRALSLGFLHRFYYQTLERCRLE